MDFSTEEKQERVTCECGQCEAVTRHEEARVVMGVELPAGNVPMWVYWADTPDELVLDYFTDGEGCVYCPSCPTRLSFDADGNPVATPMVPRGLVAHMIPRAALKAYRLRMRKLEAQVQWLAEVVEGLDSQERTAEGLMLEAQDYAERRIAEEAPDGN